MYHFPQICVIHKPRLMSLTLAVEFKAVGISLWKTGVPCISIKSWRTIWLKVKSSYSL